MRIAFALFASIVAVATPSRTYATDERELIWRTVNLYQLDARITYGHEIDLEIISRSSLNAYPVVSNDGVSLVFFSRLLEALSDDMIVAATCHELGHLFGSPDLRFKESDFAVEGESDYFAGACLVRYLMQYERLSRRNAEVAAEVIATSAYSILYQERLLSDCARGSRAGRVIRDGEYPEPNCRLLSVVHGARGWRRPECWYDPQVGDE